MTGALTFSPGQALAVAIIVLCLVVTAAVGIFQGEQDAEDRAHERQLRHEARHVRGEE